MAHMQAVTTTTVRIPESALKKGVVLLDLDEYNQLREQAVPTYYLTGKAAEDLDREVEKALQEDREGKTRRIKSLRDLR
ncbi:MAG: hypothetical protein HYT31_04040 [Parcubacteria group bacterium]|nr:hypothetical protein [Parcubacteria group bacterium]